MGNKICYYLLHSTPLVKVNSDDCGGNFCARDDLLGLSAFNACSGGRGRRPGK